MPAIIVFDEQTTFLTDPVSPCSNQPFTVSWQEKNIGDQDSDEYEDIFAFDDQGLGDRVTVQCDALPAGGSAIRSATFTLSSGNYFMTLIIDGKAPLDLGNVIISECL